jgi:hypothetical protein
MLLSFEVKFLLAESPEKALIIAKTNTAKTVKANVE